jgi:hypothetical protein
MGILLLFQNLITVYPFSADFGIRRNDSQLVAQSTGTD